MIKRSGFLAAFLLLISPGFSLVKARASPDIAVSPGKYQNYYHIRLKLTSDDFELAIPNNLRQPKYSDDNS